MADPEITYTIVTGATSGLGKATALLLAQQPGHCVWAGAEREEYLEALRAAPPRLIPLVLDVTLPESIQGAAEIVAERVPAGARIGLVNNAGIAVFGPLEYLPLDRLARQFEVSLFGVVAVTQAFLPLMRRQGGGRIVNMGSISGRCAIPIIGPYCAAKFALRSISDTLRVELAPWNVQVALIEAGAMYTGLMGGATRDLGDALAEGLPRQHYGGIYARLQRAVGYTYRLAAPPEVVARAVLRILTSKRPRPYYRVGRGAWVATLWESFVPARVRDWLVGRLYRFEQ